MRTTVSLLPELDAPSDASAAVVVIDVLRATTVMTAALAAGASDLFTRASVDEARELAESRSPRPLLCGERFCRPIDGFDLGNAPAEYTPDQVRNRTLILSTTNGTRAMAAVQRAAALYAASFWNLSAIVRRLSEHDSVHLICAGTDRQITAEDVLLAGAILDRLADVTPLVMENDASRLALHYWRDVARDTGSEASPLALETRIGEELSTSRGGRNLMAAGYEADVRDCARIDRTDVVPRCVSHELLHFQGA